MQVGANIHLNGGTQEGTYIQTDTDGHRDSQLVAILKSLVKVSNQEKTTLNYFVTDHPGQLKQTPLLYYCQVNTKQCITNNNYDKSQITHTGMLCVSF